MSQVELMLRHIEKKGSVRTPELARTFDLSPGQVDRELAPLLTLRVLVGCTVFRAGKEMHEYRIAGGKLGKGNFRNFTILPTPERIRRMA